MNERIEFDLEPVRPMRRAGSPRVYPFCSVCRKVEVGGVLV